VSGTGQRWGYVLGRIAGAWLDRISRTGSLSIASDDPALDRKQSCAALADRLLHDVNQGHVIVPFWSAHQLTIALLAAERHGLRPALSRFEIVADDSMGGEMMWQVGERLGLRMRRLHARGNPLRLEDLAQWMRNPCPFFIAVDGGGVYGTVPTGIVRLAARVESTIWPVAVRVSRKVRCPGLVADIPLRGTSVTVGVTTPLRVDRSAPVGAVADEMKRRLDLASELAGALLSSRYTSRGRSPRVRLGETD
jgi:lysophospholipid acyltransferase (LPLAT)-like uncharacterized protein